jgi:hypothetical protein
MAIKPIWIIFRLKPKDAKLMMPNVFYICRVCGLEQKNPPWGSKGDKPSFAICACCGSEFGYDDATAEAIQLARRAWVKSKFDWFIEEAKPTKWNADIQLKNLDNTPWSDQALAESAP